MELTDSIKPIYLGYDKIDRKYWFYFIKDKVPRFLAYVSYFFWGVAPENILSLEPIPESVELELEQFLTGNLSYEFVKPRKNSKTTQARKVFRTPQQVAGVTGCIDGGSVSVGGRDVSNTSPVDIPERGTTTAVKLKRKRRTKQEMLEAKAKLAEELKKLTPGLVDVAVVSNEVVNVKKQRKPRAPKL